MTESVTIDVPLNRVEGDLELRARVEDGVVVDAWAAGTMYRGFENILRGRAAMDALVITPRICGICSTSHLAAAAAALDVIAGLEPPPNAVRVRNVALITEQIQSDLRHSLLMFAVDFTNPRHEGHPLFREAVERHQPFTGLRTVGALRATKQILEIIAIIGGQWPHSSFMVPGGVANAPAPTDLMMCRQIASKARRWFELQVLGCSVERWLAVDSVAALETWLAESPAHAGSDLGFFIRFCRQAGLDRTGRGRGRFISFGALPIPEGSLVVGAPHQARLVPAGVADGGRVDAFDQRHVAEQVGHSWFEGGPGGLHPFEGRTRPLASAEGPQYSWAKAPRYDGKAMETGALAEAVVAGSPLFVDLIAQDGPSSFVRQLARLTRPAGLFGALDTWLSEAAHSGAFLDHGARIESGEGYGLTQAARGALGHWVKVEGGRISHYQIITPTAWNGSPRDDGGVRGAIEEALIGTPVRDPENPIELGHVVRSFDPCLVCCVHTIGEDDRALGRVRVGGSA